MQPTKIKLNRETKQLEITWDDRKTFRYPVKYLRDESPDANNKGEQILWKTIPPPPQGPDKEGKYEIKNIEVVGNYGIKIIWGDGYDYGIYDFPLLRNWGEMFEQTLTENGIE